MRSDFLSCVVNLSLFVVNCCSSLLALLPSSWPFRSVHTCIHPETHSHPYMPTHTFEPSCMAPFAPDAVYYMKCVPFTCVGLYGVLMYPSQISVPTCSGESSAHWVSGFGVSGPADATGNNIAHWRHSRPCCTHNIHTTQHNTHAHTHTHNTHNTHVRHMQQACLT